LLATAANQLWSWDITKLYVILDVFSRFVVGWMIACRENAVLPSGSEHRGRPNSPCTPIAVLHESQSRTLRPKTSQATFSS